MSTIICDEVPWLSYLYTGFEFATWLVSFASSYSSRLEEIANYCCLFIFTLSLMIFQTPTIFQSFLTPSYSCPSLRAWKVLFHFPVLHIEAVPYLWSSLSPLLNFFAVLLHPSKCVRKTTTTDMSLWCTHILNTMSSISLFTLFLIVCNNPFPIYCYSASGQYFPSST